MAHGTRVSCLSLVLTGCLRVVTPGGGVVIEDVSVDPLRLHTRAVDDEVCGFGGDTLVVRGAGWDPANAQLRIAGTSLALDGATASELRGVIPPDVVEGDITVVSGNRVSRPATSRFCHLGPGHLGDPRFRGVVEPRLTIMASGVAGMPCSPVGLSSGRTCGADGGVPSPDAGTSPHCADLAGQQHTVAVAFGLGSTFTASDPIFLARMVPETGTSRVAELPHLASGENARFPHVVVSRGPPLDDAFFLPLFRGTPPGALLHEEVLSAGDFTSRVLWDGRAVFSASVLANEFLAPQVLVSHDFFIGLVESYDDAAPGAHRVEAHLFDLAGTELASSPLSGRRVVGAGIVDGAWMDRPGSTAAIALTRDPGAVSDTFHLDVLWRHADGTQQARAGRPLTSAGCLALATINPALADVAAGCAACIDALEKGARTTQRLGYDLAPVAPYMFLLAPLRPVTPLDRVSAPFCGVGPLLQDGRPVEIGGELLWGLQLLTTQPGLGVVSAAVLPACTANDALMALLPTVQGDAQQQLWLAQTDRLYVQPTRTTYATLHADPVVPIIYATPRSGGRVDLLDVRGSLIRSAHVLGTAWGAWPYPSAADGMVVAWPDMIGRLDATGNLVEHVMKDAAMGVVPERDAPGDVAGLWLPQPDVAGGPPTKVVLVDVKPGATFGQVTRSVATPASIFTFPVARVGRWIVVEQLLESPAACGSAYVLTAIDVETPGSPVVLGCDPSGAIDDATWAVLYAVFRNPAADPNVPYELLAFSLGTATPSAPVRSADFPTSVAAHPAGGLVGVFLDVTTFALHFGQLVLDTSSTPLRMEVLRFLDRQAPFVDAPLLVSPDGRRLYAGLENAVMELELVESAPGRVRDIRVLSQLPITGRPTTLSFDGAGTRLLYVARETQQLGLLQ